MTLKDAIASYLPPSLHKGKEKEAQSITEAIAPASVPSNAALPSSAVPGQVPLDAPSGHAAAPLPAATAYPPSYSNVSATAPAPASGASASSEAEAALHRLQAGEKTPGTSTSGRATPELAAPSASLSRKSSTASGITKYSNKLKQALPLGQFEIENASAVPLNISLNHVGPLYYDTVKPGDVFSRQTGKVWFTIEVRVHTGPASEYSRWSVAWPILLVAGPSAAAISLAAIPVAAIIAGTTSISALVTVAVQGVSAAFSSAASALGLASRLPFAGKYKAKAITAAKTQAFEAQKFAGTVMDSLRSKGGVQGYLDELKKKGGEPKVIEFAETPSSVHDISDVVPAPDAPEHATSLAVLFDTEGSGPKGWKRKRWQALRTALLECKLVDRGWYAGREPVLRVTGGPKVVQVRSPLPKHADEMRTILEIWPLRLEKVVEEDGETVVEELARGEGNEKDTKEVVTEAAQAMRE